MSGAMPITRSNAPAWRTAKNRPMPMNIASHSAWRNNAPIGSRSPAPNRCATDGGIASITPIAATMASDHTFAPIATAASVGAS